MLAQNNVPGLVNLNQNLWIWIVVIAVVVVYAANGSGGRRSRKFRGGDGNTDFVKLIFGVAACFALIVWAGFGFQTM